MASFPSYENLISGSVIQESSKAASDLSDVIRVVHQMNMANSSLMKIEFETRKKMILEALNGFRSLLQNEYLKGLSAISDQQSLVSQMVRFSGSPVSRFLGETLPTALSLMDSTIQLVGEDLQKEDAFFPSSGSAAIFLGWSDTLVSFVRKVPLLFATGNGVCVKPSTSSGAATMAVAKLWQSALDAAGVPLGMFAVLSGKGAGDDSVGELLLKHPSFKSIYWIGRSDSALQARSVALEAGKKFFFFGSGRNPAVLFAPQMGNESERLFEQELDQIVRLAADPHGWGPYRPSRLFIQESVYKKSLEILEAKFRAIKVGDPINPETELGWLPKKSVNRFESQLKMALSETGRLVTGGNRVDERLVQPTLIRDLTNCSTLQGEELEGVFLTAASFKYQYEAVKYANTSPLGLAGYVIHTDSEKAKSMVPKLEVSRVLLSSHVNRSDLLVQSSPPVKNSASHHDGLKVTYEQGRYRPIVFVS